MVLTTYSIMANLHWLRPELRKVEKGTIIRMKHLHHLEMCLETEDIVHTKPGLRPAGTSRDQGSELQLANMRS